MFSFYEGDSLLHSMNPTIKLMAIGVCLVTLTFVFDPYVPLILLAGILLLVKYVAGVPLLAMVRGFFPFAFLAFGFFWMQVVFPRGAAESYLEWAQLGPVVVYRETVFRGAALGLRVLCYAAYGLLFVATTDPTRLVLSLVQQARLSPRYGYSLLAAYRFFPLYHSEFKSLRAAHQIRGADDHKGLGGRIDQLRRYAIPLLASAVRRAERVAIAMESRGFTGSRDRTYYRVISVTALDWVLAGVCVGLVAATILVVRWLGFLEVWDGSLYF